MSALLPNASEEVPVFFVVTPVFNGGKYIDETILSVLSQSGNFKICYHIQDGKSTDDTLVRIKQWENSILSGLIPKRCSEIQFTYESETDNGMYDAINRGFQHTLYHTTKGFMAWIASDDLIAPGAFSTIANLERQVPNTHLFGGRISIVDHVGSIVAVHPVFPFSRRRMAAGLYDGRSGPFVMQEATFWSCELWRDVGGLDSRFKLAGDWDLWRRMSRLTPYVSVDTQLGFHRRRPGQLSEGISKYYEEVDQFLSEEKTLESESDQHFAASTEANDRDDIVVVRYNIGTKNWEKVDSYGVVDPLEIFTPQEAIKSFDVVPTEGFLGPEVANDEMRMPNGCRWMCQSSGKGKVVIPARGLYIINIMCRTWTSNQYIAITVNDLFVARVPIVEYGNKRNIEIRSEYFFDEGSHTIGIYAEQDSPTNRPLLVMQWRVESSPRHSLADDNIYDNAQSYVGVDGAVELIDGFGLPEGPYREHGLANRFCWALGNRTTLKIFSNISGNRILELKLRNVLNEQNISVVVGGVTILSQTLETTAIDVPIVLHAPVSVETGFLDINIIASKQINSPSDPRRLAFILERVGFKTLGAETVMAISGELDEHLDGSVKLIYGFGPWETTYPDQGPANSFCWALGDRSLLKIFSAVSRRRQLEFRLGNILDEREVTAKVNGRSVLSRTIPGGAANTAIIIRTDAVVLAGWALVEISSNCKLRPPITSRKRSFMIESVRFNDL